MSNDDEESYAKADMEDDLFGMNLVHSSPDTLDEKARLETPTAARSSAGHIHHNNPSEDLHSKMEFDEAESRSPVVLDCSEYDFEVLNGPPDGWTPGARQDRKRKVGHGS